MGARKKEMEGGMERRQGGGKNSHKIITASERNVNNVISVPTKSVMLEIRYYRRK